jgi:hypothetical protein
MKEPTPDQQTDATTQIDLDDVADVVLEDEGGAAAAAARSARPAPPPLPPVAPVGTPIAQAPAQPPTAFSQAPAAAPAPRRGLVYGLIVLAFFVVSVVGGALWVRTATPKTAAAGKTAPPPSATSSGSGAPRVITIKAVDMNDPE